MNAQPLVTFDPTNHEHIKAFKMLVVDTPSRQHPTLRFRLEHPFVNVQQMLLKKVAERFVQTPVRVRKSAR